MNKFGPFAVAMIWTACSSTSSNHPDVSVDSTTAGDTTVDSFTSVTPSADSGDLGDTKPPESSVASDAPISETAASDSAATDAGPRLASRSKFITFYAFPDPSTAAQQSTLLTEVAQEYPLIITDPGLVTADQVATLRAGGANHVLGYLDFGACATTNWYYSQFAAIFPNASPYQGWPGEFWADTSSTAYQQLVVNQVAPPILAQGFDGLFLDDVELIEHGATTTNGPCDAACASGGRQLLANLRIAFPSAILVINDAETSTTLNATVSTATGTAPLSQVIDGIYLEDVFSTVTYTDAAINGTPTPVAPGQTNYNLQLLQTDRAAYLWLWIGVEDYVPACNAANQTLAKTYVSDGASDNLDVYVTTLDQVLCVW